MRATCGALLAMLLALSPLPSQADGNAILEGQCGSCHALDTPQDQDFQRVWDRKAPDLHYAGTKFRRDWLVEWLQDPQPIRPARYPVFRNIVAGGEHDGFEPPAEPHLKLAKADAEAVADALMQRKGPDGLVVEGAFKGEKPNQRLGAMAFNKLRGCSACHQGEDGEGGVSGPSLTDAGRRLQPDFIASYIRDPQAFDPYTWMPTLDMSDKDVERLTGYLNQLGGGNQ